MPARAYKPSTARRLLTQSVAVLGEVGSCVLHDPQKRTFVEYEPLPGTVLCATPSGRELYGLRPRRGPKSKAKINDQAVRALELHERFVHRQADGFYNCAVPAFRQPVFRGELVIIRYVSDKELEADDGIDPGEIVEYEHYFEEPGRAPAYPQMWSVGAEQFYVPRGPFRVTSDGIEFAEP